MTRFIPPRTLPAQEINFCSECPFFSMTAHDIFYCEKTNIEMYYGYASENIHSECPLIELDTESE